MARYKIKLKDVESLAQGQWLHILPNIIPELHDAAQKVGRHVNCSLHGGKSDFRFCSTKGAERGLSFCTCGVRNGFQLIQDCLGVGFYEALKLVAEYLGIGNEKPDPEALRQAQKRRVAFEANLKASNAAKDLKRSKNLAKVWEASVPLSHALAEPARAYFKSRNIAYESLSEFIKFHPSLPLWVDDEDGVFIKMGDYPCIVSKVFSNDGKPLTVHRTFLSPEGKQIAKKIMPIPPKYEGVQGWAIPVTNSFNKEDGILGIAEGMETAASASELFGVPVWAGISANIMEGFVPPSWVRQLVIFADNDLNETGLLAALRLKENLKEKGFSGKVHIRMPQKPEGMEANYDWVRVIPL